MSVFEPNSRHFREVLIFYCRGLAWQSKRENFRRFRIMALLAEDSCHTQEKFAESLGETQQACSKCLKAMGTIQKQGNWVPYVLKPRDVERRFFACEQLLQRQNRKEVLHYIVTSDGKRVHYDNPKRRK